MDLKKMILRNLFLKVDYSGKYKRDENKKIVQEVKFFLIGLLPLMVTFKKKKEAKSIVLNIPIEVGQDPFLRLLQGAKAKEIKNIEKMMHKKFKVKSKMGYYKELVDDIVDKCEDAINKAMNEKKFNKKDIENILIVDIKNYEK